MQTHKMLILDSSYDLVPAACRRLAAHGRVNPVIFKRASAPELTQNVHHHKHAFPPPPASVSIINFSSDLTPDLLGPLVFPQPVLSNKQTNKLTRKHNLPQTEVITNTTPPKKRGHTTYERQLGEREESQVTHAI